MITIFLFLFFCLIIRPWLTLNIFSLYPFACERALTLPLPWSCSFIMSLVLTVAGDLFFLFLPNWKKKEFFLCPQLHSWSWQAPHPPPFFLADLFNNPCAPFIGICLCCDSPPHLLCYWSALNCWLPTSPAPASLTQSQTCLLMPPCPTSPYHFSLCLRGLRINRRHCFSRCLWALEIASPCQPALPALAAAPWHEGQADGGLFLFR